VVHEVKVDALLDQSIACPKKVLDGIQQPEDLSIQSRLFLDLAQRRLLGCFAGGDRPFG